MTTACMPLLQLVTFTMAQQRSVAWTRMHHSSVNDYEWLTFCCRGCGLRMRGGWGAGPLEEGGIVRPNRASLSSSSFTPAFYTHRMDRQWDGLLTLCRSTQATANEPKQPAGLHVNGSATAELQLGKKGRVYTMSQICLCGYHCHLTSSSLTRYRLINCEIDCQSLEEYDSNRK